MKTLVVDAILFDNDGTLIDSTPGVYAAWKVFGKQYGFDGDVAAYETHGRRLVDTIADLCHLTGEQLKAEVDRFEQIVIDVGPIILPGARALLDEINTGRSNESPGWALVTSATSKYAPAALRKAGVPLPLEMVTSDDVSRGKPFADPYLAGAAKCNVAPANCLVVEDAPSGLKSGRDAGAKTLAVCTSHTREAIVRFEPDYVVQDLTRVKVRWLGSDHERKLEVTIDDSVWPQCIQMSRAES